MKRQNKTLKTRNMNKKSQWLSTLMLVAMFMPLIVSCGGGDDKPAPVELMTEEEANIREACQLFGLNREDYDSWNGHGFEGTNVIAIHNKNTNKIFVGVYEESTQKILFTNSDVTVNKTEKIQYYENTYDCTLSGCGFDLVKKGGGLFLMIDVWYSSDMDAAGVAARACKPILYIFNGKNVYMQGGNKAIRNPGELRDWYDDSCISDINGEQTCYTINGKAIYVLHDSQLFSRYSADKCYLLSYNDYLYVDYSTDSHQLTVSRRSVYSTENVWQKSISMFEDMPIDMHFSRTFSRSGDTMTIQCKAVSSDGKTETATVTRVNM